MRGNLILLIIITILIGSFIPLGIRFVHDSIGYSQILESVVLIEIDGRHTGSGFVADSSGLIITAKHVVEREGEYAVVFADGSRRSVQGIRLDEKSDCAVLLVHKKNLRPLKMTTKIHVGQPVLVIGSPLDRAYINYVTRGIVSKIGVLDVWLSQNPVTMIDAAANPGNSGGPVLDSRGRVVGILIAGFVHNCGMNFITPSIDLFTLLERYHDEGPDKDEGPKENEESTIERCTVFTEAC